FRDRVEGALADTRQGEALRVGLVGLRHKRDLAFQSFDFEAGRDELKRRRQANLDSLPEILERFRSRLEAAGGQVHLARDAAHANQIIGEICLRVASEDGKTPGAPTGRPIVTKSKSMATEEIELNRHLEGIGMEVCETDLGEFMIQRLHQRPSHLVGPAMHLTVEQWAENLETAPDPQAIMGRARADLRQKFVDATVGISGANAAIAETGTVMIVTNEGNADLTITLPRAHVAVFGMDKLVESLDDATAILRMLTRSATGQPIVSYVNWVSGPSGSADIAGVYLTGAHGPREMHCVILDNGRQKMLDDPLFRDALTCIRCGACSNACPPFMAVSGHQFGHIYSGPIGLVLTPFHHGKEAAKLPISLCAQCNACEEICPVGIPLAAQILELRRRDHPMTMEKRALLGTWSHPSLARTALRVGATVAPELSPLPLARRPYRDRVTRGDPASRSGAPVTIFASCMVDRMTPQAGVALERILRAAGHRVEFPRGQWCCGLMCANAGDTRGARRLERHLVRRLAQSEGPIVTPSASCFGALTIDAPGWGEAPSELPQVAERLRDSTRFVLELLTAHPHLVRHPEGERPRVAYHDSCQTKRQLGLISEPRRVLELAGYEVVEMPDIALCCGFGGSFSFDWPQVADRLGEWKLEALEETGCTTLVSDNPGCLAHIESTARRRGRDLQVRHVLELVAARLA
ncbi:MAG: LUD domain-containing protein, partial [Candidatus Dormibacteraceae bacterium]